MPEIIDRPCLACVVGLFEECHNPREVPGESDFIIPCGVWMGATVLADPKVKGAIGRPLSDPDQITDPTSTGRKRAAAMHPILDGMRCDWSGLKHAGGGVVPIVGCDGHLLRASKGKFDGSTWQGDLHHGPDKNTLHNTPGVNLHALCNQCHKRWHELNNPHYDEPRPPAGTTWVPNEDYYAHDPITAFTEDEWKIAEKWWDLAPVDRGPYPFVPEANSRKVLTTPKSLAMLPHNPFGPKGFDLL